MASQQTHRPPLAKQCTGVYGKHAIWWVLSTYHITTMSCQCWTEHNVLHVGSLVGWGMYVYMCIQWVLYAAASDLRAQNALWQYGICKVLIVVNIWLDTCVVIHMSSVDSYGYADVKGWYGMAPMCGYTYVEGWHGRTPSCPGHH
jgi:hypothetical protein